MSELKKRLEVSVAAHVRGYRNDNYDTLEIALASVQRASIHAFCREVFNRAEPDGVRESLIEIMRELEIKL